MTLTLEQDKTYSILIKSKDEKAKTMQGYLKKRLFEAGFYRLYALDYTIEVTGVNSFNFSILKTIVGNVSGDFDVSIKD